MVSRQRIPAVFRDHARGRHRHVMRLAVVYRLQVGIALAKRFEKPAAVGHHAADRTGFSQDFIGGPPFEDVEVAGLGVAVHLGGIQHPDDDALGEPLDVRSQRASMGTGGVSRSELFGVADPQPGEGSGLQRIERDARHHHRSERRAPPRLVEAQHPAIPTGGLRVRRHELRSGISPGGFLRLQEPAGRNRVPDVA